MNLTMFGIRNCDTVRKARSWLDEAGVTYDFHDYKTIGVREADLHRWIERLGWDTLLNRAGTTFRTLADAEKVDLDGSRAITLMLAHPSTIKRPVLERGDLLLVGFKPDAYAAALTS